MGRARRARRIAATAAYGGGGLAAGIVYAPDDLFDDPHLQARGWPTPVDHDDLDALAPQLEAGRGDRLEGAVVVGGGDHDVVESLTRGP